MYKNLKALVYKKPKLHNPSLSLIEFSLLVVGASDMPRKKTTTPQKLKLLLSSCRLQSPSEKEKGKETETAPMMDLEEEEQTTASPSCFPLLACTPTKQAATSSSEGTATVEQDLYGGDQISRQPRSQWALDALVEAHLSKLRAHYCGSAGSTTKARDVPRLLLPSWNPPFLTAALSWLGDTWRPSSILSLAVGPTSSPSRRRLLAESIRRFRVHEAVLDEEMAEYQSLSVLNLRRRALSLKSGFKRKGKSVINEEVSKVAGVVERAQRMRYRAVEVAVRGGVLACDAQAAEFLVALAGIEEAVRRRAARWRDRAGAVAIKVQAFG